MYTPVPSGRTWTFNSSDPENDNEFDAKDITLTHDEVDGTWISDGNGAAHSTRLEVTTPATKPLWENVECTAYVKVVNTYGHEVSDASDLDNTFQWYVGGTHSNVYEMFPDGTERYANAFGQGYKCRILYDGRYVCAKETGHSVYSDDLRARRNSANTAWLGYSGTHLGPIALNVDGNGNYQAGVWIGFKMAQYTYVLNGKKCRRIKTWVDWNAQDASGNCVIKNRWKPCIDTWDEENENADPWIVDPPPNAKTVGTIDLLIARNKKQRIGAVESDAAISGTPLKEDGVTPMTRAEYTTRVLINGYPNYLNAYGSDDAVRRNLNLIGFRSDYTRLKIKYMRVDEIISPGTR